MSNNASNVKKLGWFLCWAVVFADIGTSLYYVPGILFGEVGNLSGLFVLMSSAVFILLVLKYIEITDRYPEGGGVVTVATKAFGPWLGALGGMFITVDYYLTASISSISGLAYLNSLVNIGQFIVIGAIIAIVLLGVLNTIGIKESAGVTAVVATAAFIVDVILVGFIATQVGPDGWKTVFSSLGEVSKLSPGGLLAGFAGSFLAFSGLESISQLSPAMQTPRKKIATKAMFLVIAAVMITSPLLTLFSTNLLTAKVPNGEETILESVSKVKAREHELTLVTDPVEKQKLDKEIKEGKEYSERFMSELGAQYGGGALKVAVVITASILLLFASNTAIIGAYHVFISLSRLNFLPKFLEKHNKRFDTPHWAVLLAIVPPCLIILATKGDVTLLGQLYAFGLLGAFGLSSIGLDVVRWKETKKISPMFIIGVITTVLVVIAWVTNLYTKQLATVFGGGITIIGMLIAFIVHKYSKRVKVEITAEDEATIPQGQIFIPVFDEFDKDFFEYLGDYAKKSEKVVVLTYIRTFTDVLQTVYESIDVDTEAAQFLRKAQKIVEKYGVKTHIVYESTTNTAKAINEIRKQIKPSITILSPHNRSQMVEFLRGNIVESVMKVKNGQVLIYSSHK